MAQIPPDPTDRDATRTTTAVSGLLCAGDMLAGRYRIVDTLGVGAMGVVYRAHDERVDVPVALKILHAGAARDADTLRRFEEELRLARQVTHENVVRIHDLGEHDGVTFLTMDLIDGESLGELLDREQRLPPERAAQIAAGVAAGLAAAHAQGVVHRDLKPANVLVTEGDRAILTDFGVAKSMSSAQLTRTGMFIGTPDYLAPEQARGDAVDGRADIYALGLLLYEMLAGRRPTRAASMQELLVQRTMGRMPELSALPNTTPTALRQVIERCLQKDPEARYQDAAELAQDLRSGTATRAARRWGWSLAVTLALAAGLWSLLDRPAVAPGPAVAPSATQTAAEPAPVPSITFAILPFSNPDDDPALEWISTGVTSALSAELAPSDDLRVVSEQRVRGTLQDLRIAPGPQGETEARQLANLFGADWLVAGTLRNQDGLLVVDAVMHAASASDSDRALPQVSAPTAEAASLGAALAEAIRDTLSLPAPTRTPMRLSSNLDAMRAYAEGVDRLSLGDSVGAVLPLRQAVALDGSFAAAWLKLAEAYDEQGHLLEASNAIEQAVANGAGDQRVTDLARVRHASVTGQYDDAIELLGRMVAEDPGDGEARFMLAELTGDAGRLTDAIEMLKALTDDDPNHPRAWYLLGKFAIQNGDMQTALGEYLVNALDIQERLNNAKGRADVLNAMGVAQHRMGQLEQAKTSYAAAAQMREQIGDDRGLASSLANVARIELQLGRYDAAVESLERAIALRAELSEMGGLASLYNMYGVIEEERGDFRAALRRYRQALKIREDMGDLHALVNSFTNIGFAYFVLGEYDNAGVYWQQALDQAIANDNPDAQLQARQSLGQLRLAEGDWNRATELLLQTLEASRRARFPVGEAVALGNLGRVAQRQGRYGAALSSYDAALEILRELGDVRGLIEFTLWRADARLELADFDAVARELDAAAIMLEQSGDHEQRAMLAELRGALAAHAGRDGPARQSFEQAIRTAGHTGSDIPVLRALVARAEAGLQASRDDLASLAQSVEQIGNADLILRARLLQLGAAIDDGDLEAADALLRGLLFELDEHKPYARAWMIHALAARVRGALGQTDAQSRHELAAREEVQRVLSELPVEVHTAFLARAARYGIDGS